MGGRALGRAAFSGRPPRPPPFPSAAHKSPSDARRTAKRRKAPTSRVDGPVTVVALDAAAPAPGPTAAAATFLARSSRGTRPRSAAMLVPARALTGRPAPGFGEKR